MLSVEDAGPVAPAGPFVLFDPLAPQQHAALAVEGEGPAVAAVCRARATPHDGGEPVEEAVALRLLWSDAPVTSWTALGAFQTFEGRAGLAGADAWARAVAQDEAAQGRFEAAMAAGETTWGDGDDPLVHPRTDVSEVGRRVWTAEGKAALRVASQAGGPVDVVGAPSGFGAGVFHAYAGRTAEGGLAQVLVDFRVLLSPVELVHRVPAPLGEGPVDLGPLTPHGLSAEAAAPGETLPRRADRPLWFTLRWDRARAHPSAGEPTVRAFDAAGGELPVHVQGHAGTWWVQRPEGAAAFVEIQQVVGVRAI